MSRRTVASGTRALTAALAGVVSVLAMSIPAQALHAQTTVGVEGTYLIRGGVVVVGDGNRIASTDVLIQDGVIARIAESISAPPGATEIDANGRFIYAGMIDSNTQMGLTEISGIAQMNSTSELGTFNPHIRAVVALNVESVMWGIARANGVLSVVTSPSGGMLSGQAALVNTDGWTWEDMAVDPDVGYVLNLPGGGRGGRGGFGRGGGGAPSAGDPLEELPPRGLHGAGLSRGP